jgi:hypothetical protein
MGLFCLGKSQGRLRTDAKGSDGASGASRHHRRGCVEKKVGDTVQIETEELTVVGIVEGGAFVENGSIILSLPLLQQVTGIRTNQRD